MRKTSTASRLTARVAAAAAFAAVLALTACAPPGEAGEAVKDTKNRPTLAPDETAAGFNLDALIEAAKKESPITVYDVTGKVVQIAEAFSAKYGIKATGVKIETNVIEKVRAEYAAGNVIGDVVASPEVPSMYGLLEDGALVNWVPGDITAKLPESAQYPYLNLYESYLWTYNPSVYGTCPIKNVWELTQPEWKGKVAFPDPEKYTTYAISWNQAARNYSKEYAQAYQDLFGKPLQTDEPDAVHEWLKQVAQNSPIVSKDPEGTSEAVGAPGQQKPAIAMLPGSKYRNNTDKNFSQAACEGLMPHVGYTIPQTMLMASKTKSPNAAKLYIHFASLQDGMNFVTGDGKGSFNPDIKAKSDPYGILALGAKGVLQPYDTDYLGDDNARITHWQDFWRNNRR